MKHLASAAAAATLSLFGLGACATVGEGQYAIQHGTPVTPNVTPYEQSFACVDGLLANAGKVRIAVGNVKDFTGKFSNEASQGGYQITQGGSLMVISALGKLDPRHVSVIERYDTAVPDMELTLSKAQLLRDDNKVRVPTAGQVLGSDYYIVGGITEANYNIQSGGAELNVNGVGGGGRIFVMNIAADLRLVDTKSLEVVKTVSLQKQIQGYETKANIFRFFGTELVDFNAGNKQQEPIQLGVRSVLNAGTLELVSAAFNTDFSPCRGTVEANFAAPSRASAPEATGSDAPSADRRATS
jgi:curli biogenesis system outer membrane secretion channel CsgG